jgi:hypothetical protein
LNEAPHSWQNFAAGGFSKPHFAHGVRNPAPHSTQNFAVGSFSASQLEQRISPNASKAADSRNPYHELNPNVIGNFCGSARDEYTAGARLPSFAGPATAH